ncbi:TIM barrel protein [Sphingomonas sp. 1P06PA]|uniref:sugar phosphate isomerase/epimerase family protein n=1 Tax=Sphingomonas sp. 1P06PA TaxID=554121 RepID=UPI0039A40566
MTAHPEIVASFFTIAGDLLPHDPPLVARFPIRERITAASQAGFTGMGFNFDDVADFRDHYDDATLRAMFADAGIRWIELEALIDWFADGERGAAAEIQRRQALDQAAALGVFQIKVAGDLAGDWPIDRMTEAFAGLCREAAEAGTRITIELLPFSNLDTVARGRAVVEQAGEPNGGLMFDAWHVQRGGMALAEIAALPAGMVAGIEFDDGPLAAEDADFYSDCVYNRRLPGEGAFDLAGLVAAARQTGFDGPWGIEILSNAYRALPLQDAATRAFQAARRILDR